MLKIFLWLVLALILLPTVVYGHTESIRINITKDGFEPSMVTLHQNSTVEFVNLSDSDRWPASNTHPTHDIYPEFDPKGPLKPGTLWQFQFQKVGVFKFHDHLYPHQRGVITVEGEGQISTPTKNPLLEWFNNLVIQIKKLFSNLNNTGNFKELSPEKQFDFLKNMANQKGAKQTWDFLAASFKDESGTSGNIHDLAHFVGGLIYGGEEMPGLKICTTQFAFGCYHGFLDKAFSNSLEGLKEAEQSCLTLGPVNSGPNASCVHGIGHGIASYYQVNNLAESLASCEKLNDGHTFCFDGVFMEFERGAPANFYKSDNPYYPCSNLDHKYLQACSRNQPNVLMNRFGFNFKQVADVCLNTTLVNFEDGCIDSLGFLAAGRANGQAKIILDYCQQIDIPDYMAKCVTAGAGELIFQNTPGWQQSSFQLCNSLSPNHQAYCQQYLQNLIKDYNRS